MPERAMLLALDTSGSTGSVALGRDGRILAHETLDARAKQAESLLPAIDRALRAAAVEPTQIDGIVVGAGPGSFTGVRIAGATAKGMVRALGIPLYAYSALEALAVGARDAADAVCPLLDARRGEVYAACYRFRDGIDELLAPCAAPVAEIVAQVRTHAPVFVGEGAGRYRDQIEAQGGRVMATDARPDASALLWLAARDPARGRVENASAWEPAYLRESGAERHAARE